MILCSAWVMVKLLKTRVMWHRFTTRLYADLLHGTCYLVKTEAAQCYSVKLEPEVKQKPVAFNVCTFPVLKRNRQRETLALEEYSGEEADSPDSRIHARGRIVLPAQQNKLARHLGAWWLTNQAATTLLAKVCNTSMIAKVCAWLSSSSEMPGSDQETRDDLTRSRPRDHWLSMLPWPLFSAAKASSSFWSNHLAWKDVDA